MNHKSGRESGDARGEECRRENNVEMYERVRGREERDRREI